MGMLEVKIFVYSHEETLAEGINESLQRLKLGQYDVEDIKSFSQLFLELDKFSKIQQEKGELIPDYRPIILIDGRKNDSSIDDLRKIQKRYPEIEIALIIKNKQDIFKEEFFLDDNDTFRIFNDDFDFDILVTALRLASRKNRKFLRKSEALEAITNATELLLNSEDLDTIYAKIVQLAPKIATWSENTSERPICHFALTETNDQGQQYLKFYREHHDYETWKLLYENTDRGYIYLTSENEKIGIIGQATLNRRILNIQNVKDDKHNKYYINLRENTKSQLAVPILLEMNPGEDNPSEKVLGVINLEHSKEGAFDDSDIEALTNLANQIGIAYRKQKLKEQLEKEYHLRKAVQEAISLVHSSANLEETFQRLTEQALLILGRKPSQYCFAHIRQLEDRSKLLKLKAVTPDSNKVLSTVEEWLEINLGLTNQKIGISGQAVKENKLILIKGKENLAKNKNYIELSEKTEAQISIPLRDQKEQAIGVLSLETDDQNDFEDQDKINALKNLANAASSAVISSNLLEKAEKELDHRLGELRSDHEDARQRSRKAFDASARFSIIGYFIIIGLMIASLKFPVNIQLISAIFLEVISVLFLMQADKATSRLDEKFNKQLTEITKFKMLLDESERLPSSEKQALIHEIISDYKKAFISSSE